MIGQLLDGRYRVIQDLSLGGFGLTYLAEDTKRPGHPQCVVKQLRPPSTQPNTIKLARQLFRTEAETLERLGQHDQIPRLFAYFEDDPEFYLIQEFIPGHPLSEEILPGHPLSEDRVVSLFREVLEILVFVHGQGVIHRDIKPSNLMRRQADSKIVLIDFGAVKAIANQIVNSEGQVTLTAAIGTPNYMPVEQFHSNPQFNSDIYALGVIGIQALTGLSANDISKLRNEDTATTSELDWRHRTQVRPALANIIDRMVRLDYRQRYQSATQVLTDLTNLIDNPHNLRIPRLHLPPKALWFGLAGAGVACIALLVWVLMPHKDPSQVEANHLCDQGSEKLRAEDYKAAIDNFDRCIQLNPKNGLAYLSRGDTYYALGDYKQAVDNYDQALSRLPQNVSGIGARLDFDKHSRVLTVGKVFDDSPASLAGLKVGDEILEINGQSTDNMSQDRVSDLLRQGDVGTPVTLQIARQGGNFTLTLKRASYSNSLKARVYNNRGLAQFKLGDDKRAIEDYKQALQIDPNYFLSYFYQGVALLKQGDKQGAVEQFDQAIQKKPDYAAAYLKRGLVHRELRQEQAAIQDFNQVTKIDPSSAEDYNNQGSAKYQLGDKQGAIEDFDRVIQLKPNYAEAYDNRGKAKYQSGSKQGAIEDFNQAIQLNPNSAEAYNNRGSAKYQSGDQQGAIEDFNQVIKLNPNYAEAYYNRGQVRANLGDQQGAIGDYDRAIKLNPNYAEAYYNRGLIRSYTDRQAAIGDFQKAKELYLEHQQLSGYNEVLAQLKRLGLTP